MFIQWMNNLKSHDFPNQRAYVLIKKIVLDLDNIGFFNSSFKSRSPNIQKEKTLVLTFP